MRVISDHPYKKHLTKIFIIVQFTKRHNVTLRPLAHYANIILEFNLLSKDKISLNLL